MQRPRLTYSNVMSTLGVFFALGGTSYAVAKLPAGSVGSRELRKGAVTAEKIASGAVNGGAVKDGAIGRADLAADAAVPGPRGPRGAEGPAGASAGETLLGAVPPIGTFINLPNDANGRAALGTLVLPAGAWNIDAHTRLQYETATGINEWVNCDLVTPSGDQLTVGSALVGGAAPGAGTQFIPLTTAATFTSTTKLTLGCQHYKEVTQPIAAVQTALRATRVVRVEQQK